MHSLTNRARCPTKAELCPKAGVRRSQCPGRPRPNLGRRIFILALTAPSAAKAGTAATSTKGAVSKVQNVSSPAQGLSGVTGAAQNVGTGGTGLSGVTGGASPVSANLPVIGSAAGSAGSAVNGLGGVTSQVPVLGVLGGGVPGLGGATGALGNGS